MVDLFIQHTDSTPEIGFSLLGLLRIKGVSRAEDARGFYREALNWLVEYGERPSQVTVLDLTFSYLDTASVRCMLDFVRAMHKLEAKGFDISVNWYFEEGDDDLYDVGEALRSTSKVKLNLIELDLD